MDEQPVIRMDKPLAFDVDLYRTAICAIVAAHRGGNPRLFGSLRSGTDNDESQFTPLVDRTPGMRLLDFGNMYQELTALLGITVDIWTPEELPGWLKEEVLAECVPLSAG
jgi:predicted nucleotidyltransferase